MKVKNFVLYVITFLLVFSITNIALASSFSQQQAGQTINKAINYLHSIQNDDGGFPAKKGQDSSRDITAWVIMALVAAGEDVTGEKWASYGQTPVDYLKNSEDSLEATNDYARTLLALTAANQGTAYKGMNLAGEIASFQQDSGQFAQVNKGEQGLINSHMWSILALASTGQDIPNKEPAKQWLLNRQNEDGGFGWAEGVASDADDTGVAIQTLVLLGEDPQSSPAIKDALNYLKKHQEENGGFSTGWMNSDSNSATDAWVLQGLLAAGEDPVSKKWSVDGKNAVTHLLSLQSNEGFFNWKPDVKSSPVRMTAFSIMALAKKPFPVNIDYSAGKTGHTTYEDKNVISDTGIFSDLSSTYWAYNSIMALVNEKVLSGYPDGTFKPGKSVTRAEFTKFMVYGLGNQGMSSDDTKKFTDVPEEHWAYNVISIAANKGYVNGKSEKIFDPDGNITGAELAAMLVRALPPDRQEKVKAGPHWYSASVRLAEKNGLLYPNFKARANATRAQCAYSIVQLRMLLRVN